MPSVPSSLTGIALYAFTLFAGWTVYTWMYNLFFHPLAKFPGPRLAGMTPLWRSWRYLIAQDHIPKLLELHKQFGNVVRISPNELHFSDPDAYGEIYHPNRRWTKDPTLYGSMVDGTSTWSLLDYPRAKKRREVLLSHFSRKSILELQYLVQERVDVLCDAITTQVAATGKSVNFTHGMRCFAIDTITSVCFAKPLNATWSPDFKSPMVLAMDKVLFLLETMVQFPAVRWLVRKLPPAIMLALTKSLGGYNEIRSMLSQQILAVLADPSVLTSAPHPIIYHSLLTDGKAFSDKTDITNTMGFNDLNEEAFILVFAGTDSTGAALTTGTIHCVENKHVYNTLKEELKTAWPVLEEKPTYETLEKLPYLTGVIKEALRLSHGAVSPPTRVVPEGGVMVSGHPIPEGTIVGMSNCLVHWSENIFPEARKFKPERWLGPQARELEPYLVTFSKGPRSCVGVNLGYCELYIAFANLFRRYDMELDGISSEDLKWIDLYIPLHVGPEMRVFTRPVTS
ncbi:cytochrome P450 [Cristinia sonorae]|uniref:Cytochrome P450 n=1 Tax=Cristinia sonorae TaxID=1940300 RepID=A0A8K0UW27_9AGAR|nr:cytochrome P450 [Cristinia sonorae]